MYKDVTLSFSNVCDKDIIYVRLLILVFNSLKNNTFIVDIFIIMFCDYRRLVIPDRDKIRKRYMLK